MCPPPNYRSSDAPVQESENMLVQVIQHRGFLFKKAKIVMFKGEY